MSDERARILMSWDHNSGFSIDDSVRVEPEDGQAMERMARYILRRPLSLKRMQYSDGADEVVYARKTSNGQPGPEERFDALDFLARVIAHIPAPRIHLIRYLGHYSNVSRGRRKNGKEEPLAPGHPRDQEDDGLTDGERRARRKAWARLVRRIYEIDPMECSRCGGRMQIVSVILEHKVITKILSHLARKGIKPGRAPPEQIGASTPESPSEGMTAAVSEALGEAACRRRHPAPPRALGIGSGVPSSLASPRTVP